MNTTPNTTCTRPVYRRYFAKFDQFGSIWLVIRNVRIQRRWLWYFADTPEPSISTSLPRSILIRYVLPYYKKLSVKIVFLVNDGLFEHFLINKVHENVEIRVIENIQIPFRIHGNVLFRTCYRMCAYVKFNPFSFFYQKY